MCDLFLASRKFIVSFLNSIPLVYYQSLRFAEDPVAFRELRMQLVLRRGGLVELLLQMVLVPLGAVELPFGAVEIDGQLIMQLLLEVRLLASSSELPGQRSMRLLLEVRLLLSFFELIPQLGLCAGGFLTLTPKLRILALKLRNLALEFPHLSRDDNDEILLWF